MVFSSVVFLAWFLPLFPAGDHLRPRLRLPPAPEG